MSQVLSETISFVEFSRVLGADHFVFYNHSGHPSLIPYLQSLVDQGLATIKDWTSPPVSFVEPIEIHWFGQSAAFQYCIYQFLYRTRYIVDQDIDEMIIPVRERSWHDLMARLPPDNAGYIARMALFPMKQNNTGPYADDPTARLFPLLVKLMSESKIYEPNTRPKHIAGPRFVEAGGFHYLFSIIKEAKVMTVSPSSFFITTAIYRTLYLTRRKVVPCERALAFADAVLANVSNISHTSSTSSNFTVYCINLFLYRKGCTPLWN
jgi:hypothetical protein